MNTIINYEQQYLLHTFETRYHAVKTYRNGATVAFVCRRYKVSKASLMRCNKRYDGNKESLIDKSHRPNSKHPNSHADKEITEMITKDFIVVSLFTHMTI